MQIQRLLVKMHSGGATVLCKSLWTCSQLITSPASWSFLVPGYTGANLRDDANWCGLSKTVVKTITNSAFGSTLNVIAVLQ